MACTHREEVQVSLEQDIDYVKRLAAEASFSEIAGMIGQVLVRDSGGRFRQQLIPWLSAIDRTLWPWRYETGCVVVCRLISAALFQLSYPPHGVDLPEDDDLLGKPGGIR